MMRLMKSLTILLSAAAFAFVLPGPGAVRAQDITATFTGTEDGFIWEVTGIEAVTAITAYDGSVADALALLNQVATGNVVEETNVTRSTVYEGSGQGDSGIVGINQASGNFNNQGIVRAIAFVGGDAVLHLAAAYAEMDLTANTVLASGPRETRIEDSFHGTVGIVGINQSAGNLNQEGIVLALTMGTTLTPGIEFVVMLGDSELGGVGGLYDNTLVEDLESPRSDTLVNSFGGFTGLAQVNQSSGDLNRIGNVLGVSISIVNIP